MKKDIRLHIDELILHGFASSDRYRIAEALEHELKRLLSEQSTPAPFNASHSLAHLDAGSFEVAPNSRPEAVGTQVAQAIYNRLKHNSNV